MLPQVVTNGQKLRCSSTHKNAIRYQISLPNIVCPENLLITTEICSYGTSDFQIVVAKSSPAAATLPGTQHATLTAIVTGIFSPSVQESCTMQITSRVYYNYATLSQTRSQRPCITLHIGFQGFQGCRKAVQALSNNCQRRLSTRTAVLRCSRSTTGGTYAFEL